MWPANTPNSSQCLPGATYKNKGANCTRIHRTFRLAAPTKDGLLLPAAHTVAAAPTAIARHKPEDEEQDDRADGGANYLRD
jgi:hypothetical protein